MLIENSFAKKLILDSKIVFWDFDGVIKDSIGVKSKAFEAIFPDADNSILAKIRLHHENNGGMSRYAKIPLYLEWAGILPNNNIIQSYCNKFSELVFEAVITSAWVPGIREFLMENYLKCYFVLVTSTPIDEIIKIIKRLNCEFCFREVYGSPENKNDVISEVIKRFDCNPQDAILIGDSDVDFSAATKNQIKFLLRSTEFNKQLRSNNELNFFRDFTNE